MRTIDAGAGLSLDIPAEFQATRTGDTLRVFSPQREHSRSPPSIMVSVAVEKPRLPGTKIRRVADRLIEYEIHEEPGGSGGDGVRLRAWVESSGRFIVLDSVVQPDSGGDGEFHVEWAILPTLRWSPPK
jgi:hypothetical protein